MKRAYALMKMPGMGVVRTARWLSVVRAGVLAGGLASPGPARAGAPECPVDHPGRHHAEYPWVFGLKGGYLSVLDAGEGEVEYHPAGLAGVSLERTIVHNWLEVELTVPVAIVADGEPSVALPLDVHFKKPFHPSPNVSPYLAFGPALDVAVHPEVSVFPGFSAAVGSYFWFSKRVGIDVEFDYNLVFEGGGARVHELLVVTGLAYRFGLARRAGQQEG